MSFNRVVMVCTPQKQHVKLYDSAFVNPMIVSEQIKSVMVYFQA